jgi:hypothetical protein
LEDGKMLKKLGIATLVLGGILAVAPKANARVYFGVGPPVYSYPYAYPYGYYPYGTPYWGPSYGFGWGGGWHGHEGWHGGWHGEHHH